MRNVLNMIFLVDRKNRKIKVERKFAAPVDMVWSAWTESDLLDKWWAPKPWKTKTKFIDFKEGGFWLYAMINPEGDKHWSRADFKEISPKVRFTSLESFCDENGNVNHNLPKSRWENQFVEHKNSTNVHTILSFDELSDLEKMVEMGFEEGFCSALTNLDEVLKNTANDSYKFKPRTDTCSY